MFLVAVDLAVTWIITSRINLSVWVLRDIFWIMLAGQFILVLLFIWVLVVGVKSGLRSVNRLADEIQERSADDLSPLNIVGVTTEAAPVVDHINDLLARLSEASQSQRRFVGHAAHQLRTPLTGLRLECELMLSQPLPDDVRARAERIKVVTDRMIRLGQQLLVLARADSTRQIKEAFRRLDLADWVRQTALEWVPVARSYKIDLQLHAPEFPVWVDADPLLLEALLSNLIDNALRYGKGATRIVLHVGQTPPSMLVEDNGSGIAPEAQVRAFEAFYRAPKVDSDGSGLGLAIVQEIAQAHGAGWKLVSRPAFNGTRINIVFPGPRIGAGLNRGEPVTRC
tara:strand:+ start:17325 stop:18344 length:1020 start_codon:yes stop_codon:yes gene_type:complete